jgi:hypothetical protein
MPGAFSGTLGELGNAIGQSLVLAVVVLLALLVAVAWVLSKMIQLDQTGAAILAAFGVVVLLLVPGPGKIAGLGLVVLAALELVFSPGGDG